MAIDCFIKVSPRIYFTTNKSVFMKLLQGQVWKLMKNWSVPGCEKFHFQALYVDKRQAGTKFLSSSNIFKLWVFQVPVFLLYKVRSPFPSTALLGGCRGIAKTWGRESLYGEAAVSQAPPKAFDLDWFTQSLHPTLMVGDSSPDGLAHSILWGPEERDASSHVSMLVVPGEAQQSKGVSSYL